MGLLFTSLDWEESGVLLDDGGTGPKYVLPDWPSWRIPCHSTLRRSIMACYCYTWIIVL